MAIGSSQLTARGVHCSLRPDPRSSERAQKRRAHVSKVRPLNDRVLVKRVASETKTKGGIIIPETAKEKPLEGTVVAVGPGAVREDGSRREPLLRAGQRVLFGRYDGSEVKIDGEEHLILRETDVLGIVE
jgi:chaperonin GroES